MELHELKVKTRVDTGKEAVGRLRKTGNVPAVLYGGEGEPVSVQIDLREFTHLLHGRGGAHAVVQLTIEDNPELSSPALLKAVDHHPLRGDVTHADFLRIRLDERITTLVTIELTGRSKGVVEGGVLDHQLREVEVECLALEVPEMLELDVTELEIGDSLHVSDLPVTEGVTILTDPERGVVAVHQPRLAVEAAEEEGEEGEEGAEGEGGEGAEGEAKSEGGDE